MDVESCATCQRHTPARCRCSCCGQVLCDNCVHIEVGALWCAECLEEATWYVVSSVDLPGAAPLVADVLEF